VAAGEALPAPIDGYVNPSLTVVLSNPRVVITTSYTLAALGTKSVGGYMAIFLAVPTTQLVACGNSPVTRG
jgi:hypothetical protein